MTRRRGRRAHLGKTWLALALGVLALLALPSVAAAKDRNHDRIPDRWEQRHRLSLEVNQAHKDQDHDALRNRAEFLAGDNPRDADSDGDGVADGDEQAGTISSFDAATGRLVIDLFGTDTVSGFVTAGTEIECEDEDHHSASVSRDEGPGSGEEEPGDDHGDHGEEVGDDHGDHAEEEPGDDHDGDSSGPGSENSGPGSVNSGDHEGEDEDHHEHGDDEHLCTSAELVPGAVVEEAELRVADGKAIFTEVELSGREA